MFPKHVFMFKLATNIILFGLTSGKTSMVLGMIFWGKHRFNCARLPEGMTFDKVGWGGVGMLTFMLTSRGSVSDARLTSVYARHWDYGWVWGMLNVQC